MRPCSSTTMRSDLLHRCQPVRDDQRGAALHRGIQALCTRRSDSASSALVASSSSSSGGVLQHRARDRDALALPAGQAHAALAQERLVALRQPRDEFIRQRQPWRHAMTSSSLADGRP